MSNPEISRLHLFDECLPNSHAAVYGINLYPFRCVQDVFCSVASLQPESRYQSHLSQLLESAAPQAAYVAYLATIFGASEGDASISPAVQVLL